MTTVAFVFLTLFTWMVSSGTQLTLDQCTELSQYGRDEETRSCSSSASYKNVVIHGKTKLTLTCDRSPEMSVASERISRQDRIKKDSTVFPGVTLSCMIFNGCVNLLQSVKQNRHICKCQFHQLLVYFLCKTSYLLLAIEIKTDYHSVHLNYTSICPSVHLRYVAHCSHIITLVLVDNWKTLDCICICKATILQGFLYRELGPAFPEFCIFILSQVRICYVQMPSKFSALHFPRKAFLTKADGIKCTVYTGKVESLRPSDTSKWVTRYCLASVVLLGIYMTGIKISPNRVSHARASNSTMVMLFTMTMQRFSPSVTIHRPSEWYRVAVRISFDVCLSCALGRTVHVLITCRAAHTVMQLFRPMQQQFRTLPVTVLFICWLTFSRPYKCIKHWFADIFGEGSVGSTLRSWAIIGQIVLLSCVFVSLYSLPQSILTTLNFLSILLHVLLVTCLQNSRVPTKYVLVIKINRLI